jgi:hypothetical protein
MARSIGVLWRTQGFPMGHGQEVFDAELFGAFCASKTPSYFDARKMY